MTCSRTVVQWTAQFFCLMKLDHCEIWGCCGALETFALLVCCTVCVSWLPVCRESLRCASLRVKILNLEDCFDTLSRNVKILNLEDGIDTLSRNVDTDQPTLCNNPKEQKAEGRSSCNALDLCSQDKRFEF